MPKTAERTWTEAELEAEYGPRFDALEKQMDKAIKDLKKLSEILDKRAAEKT